MKPFLLILSLFSACATLAVHYELPFSRSSRFVMVGTAQPAEPALPGVSVKTVQIATTVTTMAGVVSALSVTQVAQGSRAQSVFQMVSCDEDAGSDAGAYPSLMDSPTQLAIGGSTLQYDLGAVIGNWGLLGATASLWTIAALKFGVDKARYPGGLTLPVLFLITPTVTSAVNLLREGSVTQKLVGGCSITAQVIGIGLVAVFLHPSNFGAQWVSKEGEKKWVDDREVGFVKHYGMLFEDYRGNRQLFIAGELLMSVATGILKSYQATQGNCKEVVASAAVVSIAYLLSMGLLRPNAEPRDRIFYTAIAGIEALALSTQAIALWAGSKETQAKVRRVTESIVMVAEWALFVKSIYDIGRRIKSVYDYFKADSKNHLQFHQEPLFEASLLVATVASESSEEELRVITRSPSPITPIETFHITTPIQDPFDYLPEGWMREGARELAAREAEESLL